MELIKRKYKKQEVLDELNKYKIGYEEILSQQKDRILELVAENKKLNSQLESYKNRDNLINSTLQSAEKKAQEIEETIRIKYEMEVERLKKFQFKWNKYFTYLNETYPYYKTTEETNKVIAEFNKILGKNNDEINTIIEIDEFFDKNIKTKFNPKEKIENYLAVTENNDGFNMNDILNPGELDLEDLCKELGMMDEK